ncbi:tail fiber domain-containing protein, partial [bacterium]|nr:tail fiber domain-containing protein [bacterium]
LGEQTTADGLIWRGVASDTTKTVKTDTSAWIVLDTASSIMYHYDSSSVGRKWLRLNLLPSDTASMLTPYIERGDTAMMLTPYFRKLDTTNIKYVNTYGTQTVNGAKTFTTAPTFSTALSVASGGTGRTTMPEGYILHGDGTSVDTAIGLFWNRNNRRLGVGTNSPFVPFQVNGAITKTSTNFWHYLMFDTSPMTTGVGAGFQFGGYKTTTAEEVFAAIDGYKENSTSNNAAGSMRLWTQVASGTGLVERVRITSAGLVGVRTDAPTEYLDVNGTARLRDLANASNPVNVQVDVNGVLIRTSSIELKDDVQNLPYGLKDLLLLNPYKFNYKDKYKYGEGYDIGFIAEDVNDIIPEAVGTGVNSDIFMDSVKLIPILTKAIQEQQALIKALEQRIINLENK